MFACSSALLNDDTSQDKTSASAAPALALVCDEERGTNQMSKQAAINKVEELPLEPDVDQQIQGQGPPSRDEKVSSLKTVSSLFVSVGFLVCEDKLESELHCLGFSACC